MKIFDEINSQIMNGTYRRADIANVLDKLGLKERDLFVTKQPAPY
jgi:hypothetical protein